MPARYIRAMFEKFGEILYDACAYKVEDIKNKSCTKQHIH